jgi:hypothetical protein
MRALLLAGGLSLGSLALGGFSPAMAHVGHGDEFQQQGNVRQVKASAEIDSMLGITTAPATETGGVVSIPVAAVVDADGKPLAFVKSGTTYDPTAKAAGASLPMLALALLLGHPFPPVTVTLALLGIGALGYGISIWLDLRALRDLGAARQAVLFSTAPFVGALFSVVVLRDSLSTPLLLAMGLMGAGVVLLLLEQHSHWHRHDPLRHAHRHRHDPRGADPHHEHDHAPEELLGLPSDHPFWHAHEHRHRELEHAHPHVSDAHHRHRH